MTPFLQLTIALAIIIAAAKAGGYLSYRLGQPSVLGELIVGILLGPSIINLFHLPFFTYEHLPETIRELAEFGVLFLMFIAGLELHLSDLAKSRKIAALAGTLGVLAPLGLGIGLGLLVSMDIPEATFLGLVLAATSVSISAQTLMELKALNSRVGISLLGAAVFDDILVVLGLSIFSALVISEADVGILRILLIALQMLLYLGIATALGYWLIPKLAQKIYNQPISQGLISFTIVTMLLYAYAAEALGGMAAITGAFLAGLLFAQSSLKERIERGISPIAYGLFVPIFFINVGLTTNVRELVGATFWLFVIMTVIAIIGKVIGAGAGALIGKMNSREALQMGIGMMSRGEVGLIVAAVGVTEGVLPQDTFSAVVGVVIITTLLTPPALRASFKKPKKPFENPGRGEPATEGEL
jgi:Kef-type K+ transport system membrane component KefB